MDHLRRFQFKIFPKNKKILLVDYYRNGCYLLSWLDYLLFTPDAWIICCREVAGVGEDKDVVYCGRSHRVWTGHVTSWTAWYNEFSFHASNAEEIFKFLQKSIKKILMKNSILKS